MTARTTTRTNTDGCGGNQAVGANGLNEIWPGEPLDLVWEMNDQAALPDFRIAYSPDGTSVLFGDNIIVDNIQHNGAGVYSHSITAPRELCDECSIQVLHTGYNWAGCFDLNIVKAPCGGSCATTGNVENGKLNYKTGEVTCNSGYKKTSDNTCVSSGMNGAAAFFLSIFVILMFCIIVFAILVALRRTGNLPEGVGKYVEKGEHLTAKAFNKTKSGVVWLVGKASGSSSSSSSSTTHAATTSPSETEAQTTQQTQQTQQSTPQTKPSTSNPQVPVASPGGFFKGMQCQAKFTGDGQYYRATIKDVNTHTNQYLVSYPDYGTEEVKNFFFKKFFVVLTSFKWVPVTSLKR